MPCLESVEYTFSIYRICTFISNYNIIRANEICKSKGRVKITVNDVYEALSKSGMEDFIPEVEEMLIELDKVNISASQSKGGLHASKKRKIEEIRKEEIECDNISIESKKPKENMYNNQIEEEEGNI